MVLGVTDFGTQRVTNSVHYVKFVPRPIPLKSLPGASITRTPRRFSEGLLLFHGKVIDQSRAKTSGCGIAGLEEQLLHI